MSSVILRIDVPESFRPKAGFALKTMLSAFFLCDDIRIEEKSSALIGKPEKGSFLIYYGTAPESHLETAAVCIKADPSAFSFYEKRISRKFSDVFYLGEDKLPVLFGAENKKAYSPIIQADLVASAFYFLSDWESRCTDIHPDMHGRIPFAQSLASKIETADYPLVNCYAELIRDEIQAKEGITLNNKSFDGRPFAACITHDFDRIKKKYPGTFKREFFDLPVRNPLNQNLAKRLKRAAQTAADVLKKGDGYERSILGMFALEEKLKVPPTVLFKSIITKHERDAADYLEYPFMETILARISSLGGEAGFHGSYEAGYNSELFAVEKKQLEKRLGFQVKSHRFHYLRYDHNTYPKLLEKLEIRSDSSLGWAERAGFRTGFTWPYYLFDTERNRTSKVLGIPMHMMDVQLLYNHGLSADKAVQFANKQAEMVKKHGGVLCWNFHHHALDNVEAEGGSVLFDQSLGYLQSLNPIFLTLGNVHENI